MATVKAGWFDCDECQFKTKEKDTLTIHKVIQHKGTKTEPLDPKPLELQTVMTRDVLSTLDQKCSKLDCNFKTEVPFLSHSSCNRKKMLKCKVCGCEAGRPADILAHYRKHHPNQKKIDRNIK